MTGLLLFSFALLSSIYLAFIFIKRNIPVISLNKYGFIYAPMGKTRYFIPKETIDYIELRNTPNKRIIIGLKNTGCDYNSYLKNISIPKEMNSPQSIPHIYGDKVAVAIELLNAQIISLNREIQAYMNNENSR